MFIEGEMVIINEKASKGLPYRVGTRGVIVENLYDSSNYDYLIEFDDSDTAKVKESELNKLSPEDVEFMSYIFTDNKVKYGVETAKIIKTDYIYKQAEILFKDEGSFVASFSNLKPIEMEINNVLDFKFQIGNTIRANTNDHLNGSIGEIVSNTKTDDGINQYTVLTGENVYFFEENELELTEDLPFSDIELESPTEELLNVFFEHYRNEDDTYTIPKELLINMLKQMFE